VKEILEGIQGDRKKAEVIPYFVRIQAFEGIPLAPLVGESTVVKEIQEGDSHECRKSPYGIQAGEGNHIQIKMGKGNPIRESR
jgi:hypothetical protein